MPDDPPRSPSGQQSDPRPAAGAPPWWGALGRPDLPLDGDDSPAPIRMAPPAHSRGRRAATSHRPRRWTAWVLNSAVLALAVLIICIGVGVVSFKMFLTVGLLFGVPLVLAALTAVVVARRSR
jgi:uncharacterized integral membrane protein